jgi:FtsP/CotA-like multicopper oxidase with cupredoxin domain
LPNKEDGVPFLQIIAPNTTHKYTFPIIQNGTHWYHSHSGLQEQIGMYGAMILKKKKSDLLLKGIDDLPQIPVVLSEWTDYNPKMYIECCTQIGLLLKGTTQSYAEAIMLVI